MNWIILIVAGFFESGFAFCLGKMKEVSGTEWYLWGAGFACQGGTDLAYRHSLSRVDGHRRSRYGSAWHRVFPRAGIVPPIVFHHHAYCLDCGTENGVTLNPAARMDWIILIIAGLFETAFAFCLGKMKGKKGRTYRLWATGFVSCLIASMWLLAVAVQALPIGTAYPVWTGIGAVGTVLLGIVCFHERASFARIFFMATLIASIIGLRWKSQLSI